MNLVSEKTNQDLIESLVASRPVYPAAAAETTLLCYSTMGLIKGNVFEKKCGERVIRSIFRRHYLSTISANNYITKIKKAKKSDVVRYLLTLQPYREAKVWLITEI